MKDVMEYLRARYMCNNKSNDGDAMASLENAARLAEALLFQKLPWYKKYKLNRIANQIAHDLAYIRRKILCTPNEVELSKRYVRSKLIKNSISSFKLWDRKLNNVDINILNKEILNKYDYYLSGVLITNWIRLEEKKYVNGVFINVFLGILSAITTVIAVLLRTVYINN